MPDRGSASTSSRAPSRSRSRRPCAGLIWSLGLGAFGLAWSITTVAAYLPPVLGEFTDSATLIGLVLAAEGSSRSSPALGRAALRRDRTPFGRRRPFMAFALGPMALSLAHGPLHAELRGDRVRRSSPSSSRTTSTSRPTAASTRICCRTTVFGRAQGVQHVLRGIALGVALVGGGFLLSRLGAVPVRARRRGHARLAAALWSPLVHETDVEPRRYERFRSFLAAPWRIVRREKHVRRFLIANTAWEATFAGMRTFVVLYIIDGLDQPLYVSSTVLARRRGRLRPRRARRGAVRRRVRHRASDSRRLGRLRARAPRRRLRADVALVVLRADRAGRDRRAGRS